MTKKSPPLSFEQKFTDESSVKDLPKPFGIGKILGPGVIILATAIGSGEILFWPNIATQHGFGFLWLVFAALFFQYILNTEFSRYSLATGEPVVLGFSRLSPVFGWFFLAAATLPWIWPGWATGGATAATWVFGGNVAIISAISLVVIGVILTSTKIIYQAMELTQKIAVSFVLLVSVMVGALVIRGPELSAFVKGLVSSPFPLPESLALPTLLAALAFAGAGGTINLTVSNWVRDKGLGMGQYSPKIVNMFSGNTLATNNGVFRYTQSPENNENWKGWWKLVRREQKLTFLAAGAFGLAVFMLIAVALADGKSIGSGMTMVSNQVEALRTNYSGWISVLFALSISAIFFTSALGVLDHSARLVSTILKSNLAFLRNANTKQSSESAIYYYTLWGMIAFGLFVLLIMDVTDPPTLLTVSGSLSGLVMFVYSITIVVLNIRMKAYYANKDKFSIENNPFNVSKVRQLSLYGSILLYGGASAALIYNIVTRLS